MSAKQLKEARMKFPAWLSSDDKPATEMADLLAARVDGVSRPAHRREFLISKGADDELRTNATLLAESAYIVLKGLADQGKVLVLDPATAKAANRLANMLGVGDELTVKSMDVEPSESIGGAPIDKNLSDQDEKSYQNVPPAKFPSAVSKALKKMGLKTVNDKGQEMGKGKKKLPPFLAKKVQQDQQAGKVGKDEESDDPYEGLDDEDRMAAKVGVAVVAGLEAISKSAGADRYNQDEDDDERRKSTTSRPQSRQEDEDDDQRPVRKSGRKLGSGIFRDAFFGRQ